MDTGTKREAFTALNDPLTFNTDNEPSDSISRSDNRGSEPVGTVVGRLDGRPYAFLGSERQGGLFALDLSGAPESTPIRGYVGTWPDDLGSEGLAFVGRVHSPVDRPLVLVTNEVSGTLAVFGVVLNR